MVVVVVVVVTVGMAIVVVEVEVVLLLLLIVEIGQITKSPILSCFCSRRLCFSEIFIAVGR